MKGLDPAGKLDPRALRNRKFLFFSVLYPSVLFLLIAGSADSTTKVDGTGLTLPTYMMVSMASFGALTAVLMGNSERIAKERESGWVRQLRLTTLPGRGYVFAKTASAAVVSLPSIVVIFIVAAVVKDVRLDAWQWLALTGAIWAGSLVFAALGVAIGYSATGDAVRPITMIVYFGLSLLGGLWMPTTTFPQWLQDIADVAAHARVRCPGAGHRAEPGPAREGRRRPRRLLRPVHGRRGLAVPEGHTEGVSGVETASGSARRTRKQRLVKLLWIGIWLVFLSAPPRPAARRSQHGVRDPRRGSAWSRSSPGTCCWSSARAAARRNGVVLGSWASSRPSPAPRPHPGPRLAGACSSTSRSPPARPCRRDGPLDDPGRVGADDRGRTATPGGKTYLAGLLIPALLGGFAMTGVRNSSARRSSCARPGPRSPSSPRTRSGCGSPATCTTCSATRSP